MSTVIICLVLAAICVYSIITYRKKISSGCCGSGGGEIKIKPKDTNAKNYPYEYYAGVDGMTCAHCKLRVDNAFNGLDGVYARVLEKLNSLKKADALKIIDGLILKNAKSGETVLVSCGAVTVKDVEVLGSVKKLNLKVEKADGFTGGVKIKGTGYVTDLTFGALQADIRRSTEAEIAEKLF